MFDHFIGLAKSNWLSTQKRKMMVFLVYIQPFFLFTMYHFANPYLVDASQSFWFIVINVSLTNAWGISVFSTVSDIHRDRWTGMLAIIVASPTSLFTVFFIKAMTNVVHAIGSLIILSTLAFIFYRPEFNDFFIGMNWLILVSTFVMIALFSLCFSAIVGMSPMSGIIMNFVEYPIFILGGIGFSIGLLPIVMQKAVFLFPFSFVAEYLRSRSGVSLLTSSQINDALYVNVVGCLITIVAGILLFVKMQRRLENKGALL